MKILVLNSGSSSIKFQLFQMSESRAIASGMVAQIGEHDSNISMEYGGEVLEKKRFIENHHDGLTLMNQLLKESSVLHSLDELGAIGHRVVHGGEKFSKPVIVDVEVLSEIQKLIPLAPLHNPANLDGIKVMMKQAPSVPQVAVFDTAFHSTIPKYAYMYALPYENYERDGVRRYGFHGTSHYYVSKEATKFLKVKKLNAITLHLGNGASMSAIKETKCIDTTMGLTPLEGLIMGTRSGDIDPAILFYLSRKHNLDIDELDKLLNKQSGLKGICGSNDMREVEQKATNGDIKAQLALDMFAYRIKKYIGAYAAVIGRLDCIVFTGGIGENDVDTRERCCEGLGHLGIKIDKKENQKRVKEIQVISTGDSQIKILVIPTNEELEIAMQANSLLGET